MDQSWLKWIVMLTLKHIHDLMGEIPHNQKYHAPRGRFNNLQSKKESRMTSLHDKNLGTQALTKAVQSILEDAAEESSNEEIGSGSTLPNSPGSAESRESEHPKGQESDDGSESDLLSSDSDGDSPDEEATEQEAPTTLEKPAPAKRLASASITR